jgi:hypothetical protein
MFVLVSHDIPYLRFLFFVFVFFDFPAANRTASEAEDAMRRLREAYPDPEDDVASKKPQQQTSGAMGSHRPAGGRYAQNPKSGDNGMLCSLIIDLLKIAANFNTVCFFYAE